MLNFNHANEGKKAVVYVEYFQKSGKKDRRVSAQMLANHPSDVELREMCKKLSNEVGGDIYATAATYTIVKGSFRRIE